MIIIIILTNSTRKQVQLTHNLLIKSSTTLQLKYRDRHNKKIVIRKVFIARALKKTTFARRRIN